MECMYNLRDMKCIKFERYLLLSLLFLTVRQVVFAQQVLFISSYSEKFETVDPQKKGIHEIFDANNIQLDIAYMDMKQYNTVENEENFYTSLKYKLQRHTPYNAILLGDDAALHFAEKHQKELFNGIPMVFFCVNDIDAAVEAGKNKYITGAVEEFYLKETVDVALKFNPKAKRIIALVDNTLTGKGDQKQFYSYTSAYPSYFFSDINSSQLTHEEFGKKLESITKDSIVIYMTAFEDKEGNQYTIPEGVHFISEHCPVPVYRASFGGVGEGLIGGKMVSYDGSGRTAASMVLKILNGTPPSSIPVVTKGESAYYFDNLVLKKYNIKSSLVPAEAIIINKKISFFTKYKAILLPSIIIFLTILLAMSFSISESIRQRRVSEKMKYLAEHDSLTNLPNRRAIMDKLNALIEMKNEVTVVLIDIDDFKEINDSDGHLCGDLILRELSRRIIQYMDIEYFFAGRFGGDEFLVVIKTIDPITVNRILAGIRERCLQPVDFEDKKYYIHISMGIADNQKFADKASELISNADLAMYYIKNSGKNSCSYYNYAMKQQLVQKTEITKILDTACTSDGFTIVYQPQIDVLTGKTYSYEALVRLKGSNVSPAKFIPIAEETDIIQRIGRIVTDKVVAQMAIWRKNGMTLHPVSINFSSRQVRDKEYVSYLKKQLEQNDIPSNMIEMEITESMMFNHNDRAMKLLDDFSNMGVNLALDDFGTGYSSISYLTYIPVSKIKLDKSLIDTYLQEGKDVFVEDIIRLSHGLGLKITVEGVETEQQYDRLKDFNCDYIQGYYFSKPISGSEIIEKQFF